MPVEANKAEIRKGRLAARDALPQPERLEKSIAIASHGLLALPMEGGGILAGFLPIRSEPDIRPLMAGLASRGFKVCVPAILDRTTIVFREWHEGGVLAEGVFGTLQPGLDAEELDPQIMLMPMSAFDASGHRIGYGGGYYDRAIQRLRQKEVEPLLIGIAFDCQEVASVPAEPHDVGLDAVLTESGYRLFRHPERIG